MNYLKEFGLDPEGDREEVRKRFARFLVETHEPEVMTRLLELQDKHESAKTSTTEAALGWDPMNINLKSPVPPTSITTKHPSRTDQGCQDDLPIGNQEDPRSQQSGTTAAAGTEFFTSPRVPHTAAADIKTIADQVRKWGVTFDGEREPMEFMERMDELAHMYGIKMDVLPIMMPEVLTGKALIWYRNNNQHWTTWGKFKNDFLKFFLPVRYFEQLEDEIRKRRQRPRETFKNYSLNMQNLMRHSSYSEAQKLDRIFRNALPEYLWYIRRRDFSTLSDLLEMAEDLENIPAAAAIPREHHRRMNPEGSQPMQLPPINPRTACRRCGQEGHFAAQCQNEPILFCWVCGRRDTRTIQCCRQRPGNADRARIERGGTGPQPEDTPLN